MPQLKHRQNDRIQNRYEVRRILGSGAFGTVYGCRDLEIDVPVAVKELHVLDEDGGEREAALVQFRAEATHLSKLRHPHIVSGHYEPHAGNWRICPLCGLDFPGSSRCPDHNAVLIPIASRHYLVMEYVSGLDLLQLGEQNGGRIGIETARRYALQIASALSYIHVRGLVHRDIKPENIRLRSDADEAVLLDFGIATIGAAPEDGEGDRYGTRAQRHTTGGGTVGYAPEAPMERQNPDARSDIHAFGMTWFHLLTGKDPTLPGDLRAMRTHTPRDFAPEIPAALDQLIVDCTHIEAARRPQNGAELLLRLENLNAPATKNQVNPTQRLVEPPQKIQVAPLYFRSGEGVATVVGLVELFDRFPAEAAQKLFSGEIETWLQTLGETELAQKAGEFRARYRGRPKQGLEAFTQAAGAELPSLEIDAQSLDFGSLNSTAQKVINLRLQNRGRGHLFGLIRASHPAILTHGEWDGNNAKIPVTFDANRLRPGKYTGEITLDSSAGERIVPFSARVSGPSWLAPFLTVLIYGVLGMAAGALLRTSPFSDAPNQGLIWLDPLHFHLKLKNQLFFGVNVGAILLVGTTLEAIVRRSCALWLSMCFLVPFLIIGAAIYSADLLVAGDTYLHSVFTHSPGQFAPSAWMLGGATIGAIYGTLRRTKDLFSMRALAIVFGWIATLCLFYLMFKGVSASS
ncbi:Serine/threonine protein kinase [Abditibacterium utsteinense]|uniref:Serine/threonine protein kinase n=1 Tax=Abditibacterium utsteinense TaxID=1960156 RepID=A0A2S8SUU4_9BACT|nr:serine/threonine-protein kinase [Abditibacterium utsteinense]PQV64560.1 Serine/threonine protein kinase [Abditibacterium utsteinense]